MTTARYDNHDGRIRGRKLQDRRARMWAMSPYCAMCGTLTGLSKDSTRPFNLDHKVALYKGGEDTEANSQILCIPCHDKKTEKDMGHRQATRFDQEGRVVW